VQKQISNLEKKIQTGKLASTMSVDNEYACRSAMAAMEDMIAVLKEKAPADGTEAFKLLKTEFDSATKELKKQADFRLPSGKIVPSSAADPQLLQRRYDFLYPGKALGIVQRFVRYDIINLPDRLVASHFHQPGRVNLQGFHHFCGNCLTQNLFV
jgi:hypothetical protein